MVGRQHGRFNQEGDLTPQTSPWGQALLANLSRLIAQPPAIGSQGTGAFGGSFGVVFTKSASVIALAQPGGYFGDLPLDQQDFVEALPPWKRT